MFKIRLTTEQFIEKAKEVYGDLYDLSKVDYKTTDTKVIIGCKIHGDFTITPHHFLGGHACPKCAREHASLTRTLTKEEFIEKSRKIHGDKYDYSKVEYIAHNIPVLIVCPIHGEFYQKPTIHLSGRGCPECGRIRQSLTQKSNTEEFIKKAKKVHGDKYDYSKVKYTKSNQKVCIVCPEHGEFWQEANSHLMGKGCSKCGVEERIKKQKSNTEEFIKNAKKVHGNKYNYSKVNYINNKTKVCIVCPEHGEFWQKPENHVCDKQGCPKCGIKKGCDKHRLTTIEFIEKARKVHGDKYDYSKAEYCGTYEKVCIICPKHGEFWQRPNVHLNGCGCPICKSSKIERYILNNLVEMKIPFIYQANNEVFNWLNKQKIDFYLPDYNVAIECQGIQHFNIGNFGSYNFNFDELYERDKRKNELCEENGVKLVYYVDKENKNHISNFDIYDCNVFYTFNDLLEYLFSIQ